MDRQLGGLKIDKRGLAYKGVLVRHLILPGGLEDTKKILEFIKEDLSPGVLVNLMGQYYLSHRAFEYKEIAKRLDFMEYEKAYHYGKKLGLRLV